MIPEQIPVRYCYGNNSATEFYFDFFIENEDQIKVTLTDLSGNDTVLTYGVDYVVNEFGRLQGSYITYPYVTDDYQSTHSVLALDDVTGRAEMLTIELVLPIEQPSEYNNSGIFPIKNFELSLDYLTRIAQLLLHKLSKTITTFGDIANLKFPRPKSLNVIRWNQQANNLENYDITTDINEFKTSVNDDVSGLSNRVSEAENTISTYRSELDEYEEDMDATLSEMNELKEELENIQFVGRGNIDVNHVGNVITITSNTFIYEQAVASDTWDIQHNLNKYPTVVCVDSAGEIFQPAYEYPLVEGSDTERDRNRVIVTMNGATTGKAYIN